MPKNFKKRPFRLMKRFEKPKTSKNARGYPLIEFDNFRKKSRIVPKKPKGGTFWSRLYFWKHKILVV